jgi:hypothetical protein
MGDDDSFEPPWLAEVLPRGPMDSGVKLAGHRSEPPPPARASQPPPPETLDAFVAVPPPPSHVPNDEAPLSVHRRYDSDAPPSGAPRSGKFVVVEEITVRKNDARLEE